MENVNVAKEMLKAVGDRYPNHKHPRLMLTREEIENFLDHRDDPIIAGALRSVKEKADVVLTKPVSVYYIPDGIRLLEVARTVLGRVELCALAYQFFGEEKYAQRAYDEMAAAADFKDWNPYHFLDIGEFTSGFAMGYDWLYNWMSPAQREKLADAIYRNAFLPALDDFRDLPRRRSYRWYQHTPGDNWKMVCNGGLSMCVLAIFDDFYHEEYEEILNCAFDDTYKAVRAFYSDRDGTYVEGPTYWFYATQRLAWYSMSLMNACGTDFGLTDWPGIRMSPDTLISMASNDHAAFNYGDAGTFSVVDSMLWWFDKRYGASALGQITTEFYTARPEALDRFVLYYYRPDQKAEKKAMTCAYGVEGSENAAFRTGWGEDDLFAAIHFGNNGVCHGHLDLGTFVLNEGATRFVVDFPPDNYNLKPYTGTYRYRAEGHNVPVINPSPADDQKPNAKGGIARVCTEGDTYFVIGDMSDAYPERRVVRGLKLDRKAKTVLVQDEYEALHGDHILFALQTGAEVTLTEGGKCAVLSQDGKRITARLLADGYFEVRPAAPDENSPKVEPALRGDGKYYPQRENTGFSKLAVSLKGKKNYTVAVLFGKDDAAADVIPLEKW